MKIEIIAELGINHNGDIDLCRRMIDELSLIGVDAVKFQIVSKELNYNLPEGSPLYPFFKQSDLGVEGYKLMSDYCRKKGIKPYSSIADVCGVDTFMQADFDLVKLSSSNLTNRPLHSKILRLKKPVIFSTGSGTLEEIVNTSNFFSSNNVQHSVLHCISEYPAPFDKLNLAVIPFLKEILKIDVGFSDHSKGSLAGALAIQKGATILEKHFTLDHGLDGPDHKFSLDIEEMKSYVDSVRLAENSVGDSHKYFVDKVAQNDLIKRAIVLTRDFSRGEIVREGDIVVARPNTIIAGSIHPFEYENIIGKKVSKSVKKWDSLTWSHFLE